jgi:hypothetical protein
MGFCFSKTDLLDKVLLMASQTVLPGRNHFSGVLFVTVSTNQDKTTVLIMVELDGQSR